MIIDASLVFSDAQAITVTAVSTNYVDTLAAGQTYVGNIIMFLVTTAFTAGGAATLTIAIETDDNSSFSSPTTILTLGTTIAVATLVAGYKLRGRLPLSGVERYIQGRYTVATGPMTAGNAELFIPQDADVLISG